MSGSYFGVGDKVNINQTDIEIKCEGNDQFEENQVVGIYIPPSIKFFSGKDCTLNFDIDITSDTTGNAVPHKWLLDSVTGANGLFSKCVVYAGNRQTVLETLDNYSSWCSVKYDYDKNDSIQSRRAMTEGSGEWMATSRGECGTSKSIQNNVLFNPYNEQSNKGLAPTDTITATTDFTRASVSIPIHMGLFANNPKAVPNIAINGCYIELTCESYAKVFRLLDSTARFRRTALNPMFHSLDGAGTQWASGSGQQDFYISKLNMNKDPQHLPFNVGEEISMTNLNDGLDVVFSTPLLIDSIQTGTADAPVKIRLVNPSSPGVTLNFNTGGGSPNYAIHSVVHADTNPKYKLSNMRMIVRQLDIQDYESGMMAKMKNGGVVQFDIPSVACSLASTTKNELQATIACPIEYSKCRSIVAMPSDNEKIYTISENTSSTDTYLIDALEFNPKSTAHGILNYSDRSHVTGIGDNLTSYNWLISNKITPSRKINTDKSSSTTLGANADHLIELEKALNQSHGVPCRSLASFRSNFLVGRALTLDPNTVFNGIGQDVRLLARYEGTPPTHNKLWKFFISHVKTVSVKGDSINVQQ
tara:strand:+ start:2029 stop:3789 length:1761 start_codon:yes stop_codon:yes gene_type:complete